MTTPALLVLADGSFHEGTAFGAPALAFGEIVFNTSMSGYQEILSDPSYAGQIVTLTMPHIGNYGTNAADMESDGVKAAGLVVRSATLEPSNWQSTGSLDAWLRAHGVAAISDVDTRAITRRLRSAGVMGAVIAPGRTARDAEHLMSELAAQPDYAAVDWVARVASREVQTVHLGAEGGLELGAWRAPQGPHVVVWDFGVKYSIVRSLLERGLAVTLVPPGAPASQIADLRPDGVLVSNGPGDPARLAAEATQIREIAERMPTWGICLGHQLLAQAFGAHTFKLRFGHRGPNQPVLDHETGRVLITSQNHGYAVDPATMPDELVVTQHNLNDDTVEAFRHTSLEVRAVQYHPEAGPGPHDAAAFFDEFRDVLVESR